MSTFLYEGLRVSKKLNLHRAPLAKCVAMLAFMSFFLVVLEVFSEEA